MRMMVLKPGATASYSETFVISDLGEPGLRDLGLGQQCEEQHRQHDGADQRECGDAVGATAAPLMRAPMDRRIAIDRVRTAWAWTA